MTDTPVVLIVGPRQAGKTTLVQQIARTAEMTYHTLDDDLTRLSARNDPVGLIRSGGRIVLDEVQRAPDLFLAIKKSVDEDRRPGRFLLTGSANLMAVPIAADSLAGRMEVLHLLPLAQSEIHGSRRNWLDTVFAGTSPVSSHQCVGDDLLQTVVAGGYPEALTRHTERRRSAWFYQYVEAIIQRDVREITEIVKPEALQKLLRAFAHSSGQLTNYSEMGGAIALDHKTVSRYLSVLEAMYLLRRVPPYFSNRLKRILKTPKVQFLDAGILSSLIGTNAERMKEDRTRFGPVLESFVYSELLKHAMVSEERYSIMHYRDRDKTEVDLVVERPNGEIVAVEVKAAATVRDADLRGLKRLHTGVGSQFRMGIVLYDGTDTVPVGDRLYAAPISSLWG